jgi:hypothetical protein
VDKAKEMGMDWWVNNPAFSRQSPSAQVPDSFAKIEERLAKLDRTSLTWITTPFN